MTPPSIRVVPELRAVHLERHALGAPASLLFLGTNYDLGDAGLPPGVEHTGLFGALRRFWRSDAVVLEVSEPLWLRAWPGHVFLALAFRGTGALRGRRRAVVTYAMENNDLATLVGGGRRLPRWFVSVVTGVIGRVTWSTIDRICFASPGARATYRDLLGPGTEQHEVLELPARPSHPTGSPASVAAPSCVFLGVLEHRKGIDVLLEAWERVEAVVPEARLTVIGPGPLSETVARWAAARPDHRLALGQLDRPTALRHLEQATVLAAPSVPEGRWREQIGLPIKEALASGATVVTTDQTGLAPWLRDHGHRVVDPDPDGLADRFAVALAAALRDPVPRHDVLAALPAEDGRLVADGWLHRDAGEGAADVVIVNPLAGALAHYTDALVDVLTARGVRVRHEDVPEPSVSGAPRATWVRGYVAALRRARRSAGRSGHVLVVWPVLGHLDRLVVRLVSGRRSSVVLHDPRPLVRAVGYGRVARLVGGMVRSVGWIVHSAEAARVLDEQRPRRRHTMLPHPLVPRDVPRRPPVSDRPVVRVLGQYKPDRDLELLRAIGARLGGTHVLEIIGRGWPEVDGWAVTDAFVPEDRLDDLTITADVVLVPYRRFFQSGIAVRCAELGTPFVGPRDSSLIDLCPDGRFLADEHVDSWCAAIDAASTADARTARGLATDAADHARSAWHRWAQAQAQAQAQAPAPAPAPAQAPGQDQSAPGAGSQPRRGDRAATPVPSGRGRPLT